MQNSLPSCQGVAMRLIFLLVLYDCYIKEKNCAATYVRTLCRPTMKATFLLHGLMKDDQLVSRVRYSPLRARIRRGEWSNGCPANWRTDEGRTKTRSMNSAAQKFTIELCLSLESPTHFSCEWPPLGVCLLDAGK